MTRAPLKVKARLLPICGSVQYDDVVGFNLTVEQYQETPPPPTPTHTNLALTLCFLCRFLTSMVVNASESQHVME